MYQITFAKEWDKYFEKLAPDTHKRIWKKIKQIKEGLPGRHLKFGLDLFVEEVGQYRICYKSNEKDKIRTLFFVGTHKQYEKWIGLRK